MVLVPESAVTVRPIGGSEQKIREAVLIGEAISGGIESVVSLADRLAVEDRKVELTGLTASMESSLADLQFRIANDPAFNSVDAADEEFKRGAAAIFEGLGKSTSRVVNDAMEKKFFASSLQARVAVKNSAYTRQRDSALADLDLADEHFKRAYAGAADDVKREEIRAEQASGVTGSDYPTDQSKVDRILAFGLEVDTGHVRGLIDNGFLDEAEDMLFDPGQLIGMDELARQQMMRTLNTARDRADDGVKAARAELEDDTAKAAILQMSAFNRGEGPIYTEADLNQDAPNLSVADLRSIQVKMVQQGVTVVTNKVVLSNLNKEIEVGNSDVIDHIHTALRAGDIDEAAFNTLISRNHTYNDDPLRMNPYKQGARDIRSALEASPEETNFGIKDTAVERINNAIDELDHFRETHTGATPREVRAEARRIRRSYRTVILNETHSLPAPYLVGNKGNLDMDVLDQSVKDLKRDLDAGVIDRWRFDREWNGIKAYRRVEQKKLDNAELDAEGTE